MRGSAGYGSIGKYDDSDDEHSNLQGNQLRFDSEDEEE